MEGGQRQLFCFAVQSRRRRKKAAVGRCGIKIEAALALPVFGQTRSIEFAVGVICSVGKRKSLMASVDQHFPLSTDNGFAGSPEKSKLTLNVKSVKLPHLPFGKTKTEVTFAFAFAQSNEFAARRCIVLSQQGHPLSFGQAGGGPFTLIIAMRAWSRWMPGIDPASSDAGPSLNRPRSGFVKVAGFLARYSPPPSLASAIVTEGEDPQGAVRVATGSE